MPALDRYHGAVVNALIKDGWTITDNPLRLKLEGREFIIDVGAQRLVGAERGTEKIAVEIKTFGSPSPIADLEQAVGQFTIYADVLSEIEPDRLLYLAIPEAAYHTIFAERIGQIVLSRRINRILTFLPETEEIVEWMPSTSTATP